MPMILVEQTHLPYHAETKHQDLPRVAKWIAKKKASFSIKARAERTSDIKLIQEMNNGLDGFLRSVKKEEVRPAFPGQLLKHNGNLLPPPLPSPRLLLISFLWMVILLRLLKGVSRVSEPLMTVQAEPTFSMIVHLC